MISSARTPVPHAMMRTFSLPWYGLGSSAEMLTPLAIPLTGASTLSVVLSPTALIAAGAMFLIRVRKMTNVDADARMREGREQELRAKQDNSPFAISREGGMRIGARSSLTWRRRTSRYLMTGPWQVPTPLSLKVAGPVGCAGSFNADSKSHP